MQSRNFTHISGFTTQALSTLPNEQFIKLLLLKNSEGQTVFHEFLYNSSEMELLHPTLEKIKNLDEKQQYKITTEKNINQQQNIFHLIMQMGWDLKDFKNYFSVSAILSALILEDAFDRTPLHYAFNTGINVETIVEIAQESIDESALKIKESLPYTDMSGMNILHYAAKQSSPDKVYALVQHVLTLLHLPIDQLSETAKQIFLTALQVSNTQHFTAFQLICQSGSEAALFYILNVFDLAQQRTLINTPILQGSFKNYTALHFVCEHGTAATLKYFLQIMGPRKVYETFKIDAELLKKLQKNNSELASQNFIQIIETAMGAFKDYDKLFHLPLLSANYKKEENQFICFLYPQDQKQLSNLFAPQQRQELKEYIATNKKSHIINYRLVAAYNPTMVLEDILSYLNQREKVTPGWFGKNSHNDYINRRDHFIKFLQTVLSKQKNFFKFTSQGNYEFLSNGLPFVSISYVDRFVKKIMAKKAEERTDTETTIFNFCSQYCASENTRSTTYSP